MSAPRPQPAPALRDRWIAVAGCAPSAHNTQPWRPVPTGSGVRLTVDPARTLPEADPRHEDLHLSLGCWVEALAIAAAESGWSLQTGPVSGVGPDLVLDFRFTRTSAPALTGFTVRELRARQVDRGRLLPDDRALDAAVAEFAALPGCSDLALSQLPEPLFSHLQAQSATHVLSTPAMAAETLGWLRLDPRDPAYQRDGLTADCLRLPAGTRMLAPVLGARAAPVVARALARVQPLARRVLCTADTVKTLPAATAASSAVRAVLPGIGRPPARLVVWGRAEDSGTDPIAGIARGRDLLRLWLVLVRHGLRVAAHSELKDCPDTREGLRAFLGRRGREGEPCGVFSAGRSTSPVPRAPRLPV